MKKDYDDVKTDRAEARIDYATYKAIADAYWEAFNAKMEHELVAWKAVRAATRTPVTYDTISSFLSGETFNTPSDDEELEVQSRISIKIPRRIPIPGGDHQQNFF